MVLVVGHTQEKCGWKFGEKGVGGGHIIVKLLLDADYARLRLRGQLTLEVQHHLHLYTELEVVK